MSISRMLVEITVEGLGKARGVLTRILSPRTVDAIIRLLPLEGRAVVWQSEIYFEIPLKMGVEKPRDSVNKGDMAYWPLGRAFCIFFGDMRPYSPVNLIGQVMENIDLFGMVKSGMKIKVKRI